MPATDDLVLRLLAEQHLACPICGYDLHQLTVPRCSECGGSLTLKVVPVSPPLRRAWITLLAAAALNAGLGLLLLVFSIYSDLYRNPDPRDGLLPPGFFYTLIYYAELVMIVSPILVLLFRQRILVLPLWFQSLLAIGAAIFGATTFFAMARQIH